MSPFQWGGMNAKSLYFEENKEKNKDMNICIQKIRRITQRQMMRKRTRGHYGEKGRQTESKAFF